MKWSRVDSLGSVGLVADLPEQDIPPQGFTSVTNAWFRYNATTPVIGHAAYYSPTAAPYYALAGRYADAAYYIYAGNNAGTWETYSFYSGTETDITPSAGITATADNDWTGTVFNGLPILNNGTDAPIYAATPTTEMAALTNFPASTTCSALRSFKNFLIMMDVTSGGTRYPQQVRWSSSADPNSLPASWDITDPTIDAGSVVLAETPDYVIDGHALRDSFVVYKENTTWLMQYVGPPYIFRFQSLFGGTGVMGRNCVGEYNGTHIVLTKDDVVHHDGQTVRSIADGKVRRAMFDEINSSYSKRSFVFVDEVRDLAWICIPTSGEYPDKAYLYHFPTGTWGTRTLPTVAHMTSGENAQTVGKTWDSFSATAWDSAVDPWGGSEGNFTKEVVMSTPGGDFFTLATYQFNGVSPDVTVERTGLDLGMPDRMKMVGRVRARINAAAGTVVSIQIGTHESLSDAVTWGAAKSFMVGTNRDVFIYQRGRYIAYRVTGANGALWKLEGLEFEVDDVGEY